MEPKILFEDDSVMVVDKPSGTIVHDGDGSLSAWLSRRHASILQSSWPDKSRAGIVHRLDQETSGTIVLVKTLGALAKLQDSFRVHNIRKVYQALVFGHPDPEQGSVDVAIGRHPGRKTPMAVIPVEEVARGKAREAATDYRIVEKFKDASLVEATIHTGRTHQIRLHMKYLGHPILGDSVYGTKPSRKLSKSLGIDRLMLHAKILGFPHPKTGEWIEFTSELPSDFRVALDRLSK